MVVAERELVSAEVIARDVSFEDYMEQYAEHHTEWVEGVVIKMSPVTLKHDQLSQFLRHLFRIYLSKTKAGKLMTDPFVMKAKPHLPGRQPDLQIVLAERADIIQETMTAGPADVAIEIISKGSLAIDRGEKFAEYQEGGVREYWLLDPAPQEADFFRLGDDGFYRRIELQNGVFRSTVLPRFHLDTRVLWQPAILEDDDQIRAIVEAMLNEASS